MNIAEIKEEAKTGDVLVTVSSLFVRALTWESFSHVAVVLILDNIVWVVEAHENTGTTSKILFDTWIQDYDLVFLCKPPTIVALNRDVVETSILDYLKKPEEEKRYGYWTLPLVWWNQITNKRSKHKLNVCSTVAQFFWNSTGWILGKLADPGDIFKSSLIAYRIEK